MYKIAHSSASPNTHTLTINSNCKFRRASIYWSSKVKMQKWNEEKEHTTRSAIISI
jgi:hypothetical protein